MVGLRQIMPKKSFDYKQIYCLNPSTFHSGWVGFDGSLYGIGRCALCLLTANILLGRLLQKVYQTDKRH